MNSTLKGKIELRPLQKEDAETVFEWRNDPIIVSFGSQKKTVSREEHTAWISATIFSETRKAYIILTNGIPSGQVRFDRESEMADSCVISVYLLNEYTGMGLGILSIKEGCFLIKQCWNKLRRIYAYVLKENLNAQKAFIKAGFVQNKSLTDDLHHIFELNKSAADQL